MATESPWRSGMRAQFEAPSFVDAMVAAGLIPEPTFTTRRVNPYGARRYPRLGLGRKRQRLWSPPPDWPDV